MLKTYRCVYPQLRIVVKPALTDVKGNLVQKGEYIQFQTGVYKTDNAEQQELLENNTLYGVKLFLDKTEGDIKPKAKVEEVKPIEVEEETAPEEIEPKEPPKKRGNPNFGKKVE